MFSKNVVLYYRVPPELNITDTQIFINIDNIKDFCRKNGWKPVNSYIDKSVSGSMFQNMMNFATDPNNNISATICFTAGNTLAGLLGKDTAPVPTPAPATQANGHKFTGGGVPYGYIISNGALVMDTEKSAVIQEIFKSKANGASLQQIADALNQRGIKSARGGLWSKPGIAFILKNRAYIGEQGTSTGAIPPIISVQLFDEVNRPE